MKLLPDLQDDAGLASAMKPFVMVGTIITKGNQKKSTNVG